MYETESKSSIFNSIKPHSSSLQTTEGSSYSEIEGNIDWKDKLIDKG